MYCLYIGLRSNGFYRESITRMLREMEWMFAFNGYQNLNLHKRLLRTLQNSKHGFIVHGYDIFYDCILL